MEYLIGIWLIGVVFTSLFIVARMVEKKTIDLVNLGKGQTIALSIMTCLIWPIFVGYSVYHWWRNFKVI
jgi:hypothetical protein